MFDRQSAGAGFRRRWGPATCTGHTVSRQLHGHTSIALPAVPQVRRTNLNGLTAREQEVALLITKGLTNRQIAERLVIAPRTAENHVQHIFDKVGVSSRAQLAAWVVLQGLLAKRPA